MRLEHLRISRWNGVEPRDDQARLHRMDGSVVHGRLEAYDPKTKKFTFRDGNSESIVEHDAVADMFLSPAQIFGPATKGSSDSSANPTLRIVYRDGSRYSGTVTRIEDTHLTLAFAGVKEPLRLPLAELRSLVVIPQGNRPNVPAPVAGTRGRLELDGVRLAGKLVAGAEQPDASCLVWHPDLGQSASPLIHGVSGRIVYREPTPPAPKPNVPDPNAVRQNAVFAQVIVRLQQGGVAAPPLRPLHAASRTDRQPAIVAPAPGDTIPCEVTAINERAWLSRRRFRTPRSCPR